MKNKILKLFVVTALVAGFICGCQKAPEGSADEDIFHAKDSVEDEIAEIVNETDMEQKNDIQEINCTIGTKDNAISIQAQMPDVPQNVYQIVLKENETLTKELLKEFLESDSGNINDLSEEAEREAEQSEAENEKSEEKAVFSVFGSAPSYKLSDGQATAGFSNGTGAYYQDEVLYGKCASVYKNGEETILEKTDYAEVEKVILAKLSKIGVAEIDVYKITQYRSESVTFYEVEFTPAYEGMGLVHELGSVAAGEVFPLGKAWVCGDNVACLELNACLGKVEAKEKCETILSWGQIEKILETYLKSGKIRGGYNAVLTEVEFLYYPIFKENENKLELVPVWHIYTPMSTWQENEEMSEAFVKNGATWSICVNAVSGEIVRSE